MAAGDQNRQPIKHPWDTPVTADPLVGEVSVALGHGTFISGIVRQVVPEATVLSLRVMHSDDVVYEGDLTAALKQLAIRVARAQDPANPKPGLMVDVVSLSLGYFCESPPDLAYTSALKIAVDALLDQGVVVAAAAGNYAVRRRYYPAAFAAAPRPPGTLPVLSVAALEPERDGRAVQRRRPVGYGLGARRDGGQHVPHRRRRLVDARGRSPSHPLADEGVAQIGRLPRRLRVHGVAPHSPRRRWPRGSCGRCLTVRQATPP